MPELKFARVKWFNKSREKGYGFVITDDGREVFVHITAVCNLNFENDNLKEGERVQVEFEETEKGLQALRCRRAEEQPA